MAFQGSVSQQIIAALSFDQEAPPDSASEPRAPTHTGTSTNTTMSEEAWKNPQSQAARIEVHSFKGQNVIFVTADGAPFDTQSPSSGPGTQQQTDLQGISTQSSDASITTALEPFTSHLSAQIKELMKEKGSPFILLSTDAKKSDGTLSIGLEDSVQKTLENLHLLMGSSGRSSDQTTPNGKEENAARQYGDEALKEAQQYLSAVLNGSNLHSTFSSKIPTFPSPVPERILINEYSIARVEPRNRDQEVKLAPLSVDNTENPNDALNPNTDQSIAQDATTVPLESDSRTPRKEGDSDEVLARIQRIEDIQAQALELKERSMLRKIEMEEYEHKIQMSLFDERKQVHTELVDELVKRPVVIAPQLQPTNISTALAGDPDQMRPLSDSNAIQGLSSSLDPALMGERVDKADERLSSSQQTGESTGNKDSNMKTLDLLGELSRWIDRNQTRLKETFDEVDKASSGLLMSDELERLARKVYPDVD